MYAGYFSWTGQGSNSRVRVFSRELARLHRCAQLAGVTSAVLAPDC
jgi:hypothetical protein